MKLQNGSSMVEILIAVLFLSLVAVALLQLSVLNVNTSSYSISSSQAEDYAKETLEWLRNEKQKSTWPLASDTWCMPTLGWTISDSCLDQKVRDVNNQVTIFEREVVLVLGSPGTPDQATVKISWEDSRGAHEIRKDALFGSEEY